jgi:uncharacterized protein (DUF2235 family)
VLGEMTMRHLIVCCDGTWNSEDQDSVTNVRRLLNALADADETGARNRQHAYYVPGVGTEGGLMARLVGGGFGLGLGRGPGLGLDANVQDAYHWVATNYRRGDRIALFGFSRGAYTARSLAGLIAKCGLIETSEVDEKGTWRQIDRVYGHYRKGRDGDRGWRDGLAFRYDPDDARNIPVHFIGVWDTVGSLGVPEHLRWVAPGFSPEHYRFHDVRLNPYVAHARHAVAMDEHRGPFSPALWQDYSPRQDVKQVWFPGVHMDVGGGHPETGLSDRALQWMIDEAREAIKLGFDKKATVEQIRPDPLGVLHDDNRSAFGWLNPLAAPLAEPFLALRPRAVPLVDAGAGHSGDVDHSAYERQETPTLTNGRYRPTHRLAPGESSEPVEVFARRPWNGTGLYLEPGDYTFTALGEWTDEDIASGPGGTTGPLYWLRPEELGRDVATVIGKVQALYSRVASDRNAYFPLVRREEDLPWMQLVGYVANDAVTVDGGPGTAHERIPIGAGTMHHVTKAGYFYAFANDAWGFYGNNRGSVRLTVTRHSGASAVRRPATGQQRRRAARRR